MTETHLAEEPADSEGRSWREQAVTRSLDSARSRAEVRVQRFLDAATELFNTNSGKEFTVQEVVERSGQSLHSFYQYFGGKHELLLALFEESVQQTAEHLRDGLVGIDDPLERLHRFVVNYYRDCRPPFEAGPDSTGRLRFMAEFAQQLLTAHPKEAARVFAPLVEFFEELLRDAVAAGGIRPDFSDGPIVGIVLEAIMFNTFSSTIAGLSTRPQAGDSAEYLWDLIVHGIGSGSGS